MMSGIESDVTLPQGFVIGRIRQVREQFPLAKLCKDAAAQGNHAFITELVHQIAENPGGTNLVPIHKPFDHHIN